MPDQSILQGGAVASPAAPRWPVTPAVWIATAIVFLACLAFFGMGLLWLVQALAGWERIPASLSSSTGEPFWEGLVSTLLSSLLAWCQFHAAFRRSAVRSYIVGAFFLILGLFRSLSPWDPLQDTLTCVYLFAGLVMLRWGRRLRRAAASCRVN